MNRNAKRSARARANMSNPNNIGMIVLTPMSSFYDGLSGVHDHALGLYLVVNKVAQAADVSQTPLQSELGGFNS